MSQRFATAATIVFASGLLTATAFSQSPVQSQAPARLPGGPAPTSTAVYVGSSACRRCHGPIYERWSKTRMANVVTDPRQHPELVLPDFGKPDPLVKFTLNDVAFVYGSKWKQRYFTKRGDEYYPLPAQWDVTHHVWRPYTVQPNTDWWVPHYPADNMQRPTGPLCDGCHSVNYNVQTKTVTEWNVGCERCHGPGSEHVQRPVSSTIVNPARLDTVRASDTCIQCHSQGRPLVNPIDGQYYDWPVGFHQGGNLSEFWTAHKNRMQGNDFVQSAMYSRGVTCFSCHDVHGTSNPADLIRPLAELCTTCHGPKSPNGPHAPTIEDHTHHQRGSAGSECVACHMPKIEQTIADVNVRSHTFKFITPTLTDQLKVPNPCTACHTDKTTEWAREALRKWPGMSPWRVR
jgi:predicted CXXCH cytochrome family protein